jgi:hypothetical protein
MNGLGRKLISVMRGKMHKTYTPKDVKVCISRIVMIKPKIWRFKIQNLGRESIYEKGCCGKCFYPKYSRN